MLAEAEVLVVLGPWLRRLWFALLRVSACCKKLLRSRRSSVKNCWSAKVSFFVRSLTCRCTGCLRQSRFLFCRLPFRITRHVAGLCSFTVESGQAPCRDYRLQASKAWSLPATLSSVTAAKSLGWASFTSASAAAAAARILDKRAV